MDDHIRVTFLGCGDAFSSGGQLHTCILVSSEKRNFLIDCGASALASLKQNNIDPNKIEKIFLTHLHGDHFGGIPFFILDAQLVNKRQSPLMIAGPPGTKQRIHEAMEVMFPGSTKSKRKFTLTIVEYDLHKENYFEDIIIQTFEVNHPSGAPSLALRINHLEKTITYTGDTDWMNNIIHAGKAADLFITECYFYDKKIPFHLDYKTLLEHIDKINPERVILTHMSDDMLARVHDLPYEYAVDGKSIVL